MVVEKIKRDSFVSGSTSSEAIIHLNGTLSIDANVEKIIVADKSEKESYLEELGKIIKHKSGKPIKIIEY